MAQGSQPQTRRPQCENIMIFPNNFIKSDRRVRHREVMDTPRSQWSGFQIYIFVLIASTPPTPPKDSLVMIITIFYTHYSIIFHLYLTVINTLFIDSYTVYIEYVGSLKPPS